MELQAYYAESWFTPEGARLKARRLRQAGIPNLQNWRFITLTVASRSVGPFQAYERGKDRIRRFLARLRASVGRSFKWCWKLEFHDDGYAHWHLLIEYTKRIPEEMLPVLESWWGLGRINVKRVNRRDMAYVFKYVAKGLDDLPAWVPHHKGRIRVFQASQGFYTERVQRKHERRAPRMCLVRVDLFTRMGWDERKAFLVTTDDQGRTRLCVVKLRMKFSALMAARAYEAIRRRVPLVAPGAISINQYQADILRYEHRKFAGLAGIPRNAAAA